MSVTYPITVPGDSYRGNDPRKKAKRAEFNSDARRLEDYLNRSLEKLGPGTHVMTYGSIAGDVGMTQERVTQILFRVGGGHTGLTLVMPASQSPE